MAEKNLYLHVLLLSSAMTVSGYFQFVVPGVTQTDSSPMFYSGTYPYWPYWLNRTIDGNVSQNHQACLHTAVSDVTEAWLRNSAAVNTIRLRGYSIRVSYTSDVSPGSTDVLFTDYSSSTLPTVIQEECERTPRYVWFYQQHMRDSNDKVPILEICEVQIFECIPGSYDKECNLNCSQFCHETLCYQTTGKYVNGCEDGYIGGLCTIPCPKGYFGRKCLKTCGKCLDDKTCDNVNGKCMDGCTCNEGFKGELCKTACSPGEYGQSSLFRCSDHCYKEEIYDPFFGICSKCADGFHNANCNKQCNVGYYGESCMFECGHCFDDITCNNINGTCLRGCMSGWQTTDKCDKPCRNGTFGAMCMHKCSGNCLNNETCDTSDGGCRNCAPGWEGHLCNKTCDKGRYGFNCQHVCGRCFKAEQCFHTNGSCSGGCMEGYRGEMCSESAGALGSTQDSDTPYGAIIAVLVTVIVALMTVIAVLVVILRNARKTNKTNSQVNDIDMYDSANAKPENSVYDVISPQ